MMFHRLGLIHRNQRGFTIIELLIAVALTGIVAGATTTTIVQVFDGSARTSNHMTAVRQVQNAGYWVSRDAQMAETVVTTGATGFPLTLTWIEWDSGDAHQVVYSLLIDNKLQRQHYTNLNPDATAIVAQSIDPNNTQFEFTGGSAFSLPDSGDAFTVTDAVGGDSGTITVTGGSISVATTGTATYDAGTGAWTTPAANDAIEVAATAASTSGDWTSTAGIVTAAITTDTNGNATLADGSMLVFTVTATVGSDSQEKSETRVYEILPRPNS